MGGTAFIGDYILGIHNTDPGTWKSALGNLYSVTPQHGEYITPGGRRETRAAVRMATGRVRIGWSLRAPKTETRNRNPNPKPIRVEIHHQNQTRGYPKPEWIPETRG